MQILLLLFFVYICDAFKPISFSECERTKACFKTSKACTIDTCEFGVTWQSVKYNDIDYIQFELSGIVYSNNDYIILGFSEDKALGNDGFVGCYHDGSEVKVVAGHTESVGFYQNLIYTDDQDLLITSHGQELGGTFNDETKRLSCRFRRRLTPLKYVSQLKDLAAEKSYYLFVSRRPQLTQTSPDKQTSGSLIFSDRSVDFSRSSGNMLSGSSEMDSSLAKTHGIFMVIGWIFCSSVGIIVVRYYKEMWPYTGIANEMVWFQIHRTLQGTCVLLTTIAFILIFIHVGRYSQLDSLPFRAHPILGIIVFILAFLNPLVALCRCNPNSKDRPWFNWFHFFIGAIAYCLSVPTIMIGMRLPAAGLQLSQLDYPQWILIVFVLFQFAVEIILEIHGCLYYRRNKDKRHTYEMDMEEYQAALVANHAPQTKPLPPKQSGRMFKYFMLGLHATVAAIVTIILVIIIAVN